MNILGPGYYMSSPFASPQVKMRDCLRINLPALSLPGDMHWTSHSFHIGIKAVILTLPWPKVKQHARILSCHCASIHNSLILEAIGSRFGLKFHLGGSLRMSTLLQILNSLQYELSNALGLSWFISYYFKRLFSVSLPVSRSHRQSRGLLQRTNRPVVSSCILSSWKTPTHYSCQRWRCVISTSYDTLTV